MEKKFGKPIEGFSMFSEEDTILKVGEEFAEIKNLVTKFEDVNVPLEFDPELPDKSPRLFPSLIHCPPVKCANLKFCG